MSHSYKRAAKGPPFIFAFYESEEQLKVPDTGGSRHEQWPPTLPSAEAPGVLGGTSCPPRGQDHLLEIKP